MFFFVYSVEKNNNSEVCAAAAAPPPLLPPSWELPDFGGCLEKEVSGTPRSPDTKSLRKHGFPAPKVCGNQSPEPGISGNHLSFRKPRSPKPEVSFQKARTNTFYLWSKLLDDKTHALLN